MAGGIELHAPRWAEADGPIEALVEGAGEHAPTSAVQVVRARAWVRRFDRGWAERDADLLVEPVRADASVLYTLMPKETDREGLRQYLAQALAMPEVRLATERWDVAGDDVWIEWSASAAPGGQRVEWRGIDHFTFGGDEIVRARAVYDASAILAALGGRR